MARNSRNLYSFTNTIKWRLDRESWNNVKKQSETWARSLARSADPQSISPDNPTNRRRRQPAQDAHIRTYRRLNAEQAKFEAKQKQVLKNFVLSNQSVRNLDVTEKKRLLTLLKSAKTTEELLHLERKIKTQITDRNRKEKSRTRELQRQNNISSDMARNLSIAFGAAASANVVIRTGLSFESLERSLLVTSGSAESAAENFKFVRSEAMRLGLDIQTLTSSYVGFQAAAGNKLAKDDLRQLFSGISEASISLGLNAERTQRVFVAANQMLSKGQIYSEELYGQMSESLPVAVRAMTAAAVELGKIDRNLSSADQEKQLRLLMKRGELNASIMPQFGKELSKIANANDQLAWSLKTGLNPQLAIAGNTLKELGNEMFKSMKPALLAITKSFNMLSKEGMGLAKILGKFIGGALLGLTFPIGLVLAGIADLYTILRDLFGATDEGILKFVGWAATILGVSYGISKLISGVGLLIKLGSKLGKFFTRGATGVGTMTTSVGKLNGGLFRTLGLFTRLNPYLFAAGAAYEARPGGMFSFESMFGKSDVATWLDTPIVEHFRNATKTIKDNQKVDVNVHVRSDVDASGNILPIIRTEIDNDRENQMVTFYQNLSPSTQ